MTGTGTTFLCLSTNLLGPAVKGRVVVLVRGSPWGKAKGVMELEVSFELEDVDETGTKTCEWVGRWSVAQVGTHHPHSPLHHHHQSLLPCQIILCIIVVSLSYLYN